MDDIVTRLRDKVHYPCSRDFVPRDAPCEACEDREDAADEIERLRKLGDRLFMHADSHYGIGEPCPDWVKRDLDAWQEARRV